MIAKIKKLLLIILLTVLIWVWADISGEVELNDQVASIVVSNAISRDLWVGLETRPGLEPRNSSVPITINIKGSRAKVEEFKRQWLPLEVAFTPEITQDNELVNTVMSVPIIDYVRNDPTILKLGLEVTSVTPKAINVRVEKLVKKQLKVVCVDADTNLIDQAKTTPAIIEMLVKDIWAGDKLRAYVKLTSAQIEEARKSSIKLKPYVELDPRRFRYAQETVSIKIPPVAQQKSRDAISGPIIGFVFNVEMLNKYKIEIVDAPKVIEYRATAQASAAFKAQRYHMLLDILPGDEASGANGQGKLITRSLRYNFSKDDIRSDQIDATKISAPTISFRLIPIAN